MTAQLVPTQSRTPAAVTGYYRRTAWEAAARIQAYLIERYGFVMGDHQVWPRLSNVCVKSQLLIMQVDVRSLKNTTMQRAILDEHALAVYSDLIDRPVWSSDTLPGENGIKQGAWLVTSLPRVRYDAQAGLIEMVQGQGVDKLSALPPAPPKVAPILDDMEFLKHRPVGEYMIGIGATGADDWSTYLWRSLLDTEHIIIAGATQTGKSTTVRSFLYQLANQDLPVVLYLFDPSDKTFPWAAPWSITAMYGTETDEAETITAHLLREMESRRAKFRELRARNLYPENWREYYELTGERLPLIVAVFEEVAALAELVGTDHVIMHAFNQLAMKAAAFGIVLVFVGQDFPADYFPTPLTNNFKTRIVHRCQRREHSQRCLGEAGAENLTQKGDALVKLEGPGSASTLVHGFWVPKDVVAGQASDTSRRVEVPKPTKPEKMPTEREARLALWAVESNARRFTVNKLFQQFRADGWSANAISNLAARWETNDWLTTQADSGRGRAGTRLVKPELETKARKVLSNGQVYIGKRE